MAGLTEEASTSVLGLCLLGGLCPEADLPWESICSGLAFETQAPRLLTRKVVAARILARASKRVVVAVAHAS